MIRGLSVLVLAALLSGSAFAVTQCATAGSAWGVTVQMVNAIPPAGGLTACAYVTMSGAEYGTNSPVPVASNTANATAQCATLTGNFTSTMQYDKIATPTAGIQTCGYVLLTGTQYGTYLTPAATTTPPTTTTGGTSLTDQLLIASSLFFAAMLGFKTGFRA